MQEAWQHVQEQTYGLPEQWLPVDHCLEGAVLAEDFHSTCDVPGYRASLVDGYAVRGECSSDRSTFAADLVAPAQAGTFKVVRAVVAGDTLLTEESQVPAAGEAVRITTGAPVPAHANAVVMVEDTALPLDASAHASNGSSNRDTDPGDETHIRIDVDPRPGQNIRLQGSDLQSGQILLPKGTRISTWQGHIGLLLSGQVSQVRAIPLPVVGVLSTGKEIVDGRHLDKNGLATGKVVDSNRPTLLALLASQGIQAIDLGLVEDE